MSFFHRLLMRLFGNVRKSEQHTYNFDQDLFVRITNLAEQEQRTIEEYTDQLLNQAVFQREAENALWGRWQSLSRREQQVAALVCRGYTNAEIASILSVTTDTVKTHVHNSLMKFNLSSRKELAMLLAHWNLDAFLPPDIGAR